MSPPTINSNNSKPSPGRHSSVDRFSTLRTCDPCRRRKRRCNGQKPCLTCKPSECVYYSVIPDQPRGVFSINPARRLSSGSACETCRRRKTKCDGSNPCAFCAANHLKCVNNTERRKRTSISATPDHEAMDRIEDRLRRIEQLMTVFSPSPLSQSFVRQQRHSVQGITVAKEQIELQLARRGKYVLSFLGTFFFFC
ncbi:hypothetical protein BC941DRAFT_435213 [Chlamydoabsidia padenii]|nr:hypothetical protein BC941DRAFT_435213 [Chlamydoabsidia padenii]